MIKSESYTSKITSAHCSCPKYMEWLSILLTPVCDSSDLVYQIPTKFSIRNAKGIQLDTIGMSLGVTRALPYTGEEGILDDDDFRLYLLAKILRALWDGRVETLQGMWTQIYPSIALKIIDNLDMTLNIEFKGRLSHAMQEMIQSGLILPIPMGVLAIYSIISFDIPPKTILMNMGTFLQGQIGVTNQAP